MRRSPLRRKTALKRGGRLERTTRLRARSTTNSYRRRERDLPYLRWLKTHLCAACTAFADTIIIRATEAAHRDVGGKALSHKTQDTHALPLCVECHRAPGMHRWPQWIAMSKPERRDWWMAQVAIHRGAYEAERFQAQVSW